MIYKQVKSSVITKAILLVSFVSLFTDVASEMLYPVMPVYLRSIGFSVMLIGILEGLAEMVAGLSKGFFGQFSDHRGERIPFIRWGYSMSAVSKPMLAVFSFPWWIFIARTIDRLGKGVRNSARDALLSDQCLPEHKGKVFGFHRSMDTAGAAIGPFLALLWLWIHPGDYKALFIFALVPGLIAVGLTFFLRETKKENSERIGTSPGFFSYLGYWRKASRIYKMGVTGLLAFTLFNSSDAFLLLAVKNKGIPDQYMIAFYIFYNLLFALTAYPLGKLGDKVGLEKLIMGGFILFALVYGGFGFAVSPLHFIILFSLYALFAASTEGMAKAWISNHCNKEETATAIGFYNSFSSILAFAASSLGGFIWYQFGPQAMFLFSSSGVILVLFFSLINMRFIRSLPKN